MPLILKISFCLVKKIEKLGFDGFFGAKSIRLKKLPPASEILDMGVLHTSLPLRLTYAHDFKRNY